MLTPIKLKGALRGIRDYLSCAKGIAKGAKESLWDHSSPLKINGWKLEDDSCPSESWSLQKRRHSFIFGGGIGGISCEAATFFPLLHSSGCLFILRFNKWNLRFRCFPTLVSSTISRFKAQLPRPAETPDKLSSRPA